MIDTAAMTDGRKRIVLMTCCLSVLLVTMDISIVNVALPTMGDDLDASVSGLQWIADSYVLVVAALLMLAGSLGDRFGRKRMFQVGLAIFTVASLLCSLAPTLGWLIAFRTVQAVGGSMLNPVAMSILTNVFTEPKERARAIGTWGGAVGISLALGPVLGGVLVAGAGWPAIFWINVPIGVATLWLAQRFVPESRTDSPRRLDPPAQVLLVVVLGSLVFALIEGNHHGWGSALILGLFATAAVGAVLFLLVESRHAEPLVDLRFFRSAPFSGANLAAASAFASLAGFMFLNSLYLQGERGFSALETGLLTLPIAVMTGLFGPISGRLVGSSGPRLAMTLAGSLLAAGAAAMTVSDASTPVAWLLGAYLLFGIGFGLVNTPITNTAMSGMPQGQAGVAAAIASTSRQVGNSLGVAAVGAIVAVSASSGADATASGHSAWAWGLLAACGAGVAVIGLVSTGRWAARTAERTRANLLQHD